jgi:ABC-2 type transport system permease protein
MALTGADFASYRDFGEQAEVYRYQLAQTMNELQIKHISNRKPGPNDEPYKISNGHWQQFPDFVYRFRKVDSVFRNEVLSVAAMLCWIVLLTVLLFTAAKKIKSI